MNLVALAVLLPLVGLNAALYQRHRASIPRESLQRRPTYPLSLSTRLFRYFAVPLYVLYAAHLILEAFWIDPLGPSPTALAIGATVCVASLLLLWRSFAALGEHFAPCQQGRLPSARVRSGPYRFLDHPIYAANLMLVLGLGIASFGPVIVAIGLLLLFFYAFAVRDEERAMQAVPEAGGGPRPRRSLISKLALALSVGLAWAIGLGAMLQFAAAWRDDARYPAPDSSVEVDGHAFHLACSGAGRPTVVLDAGLGDASPTWNDVQPAVAKMTRVCAFDRPGMGWSEPARGPRTSGAFVEELRRGLAAAGAAGPLVLVGHSLGGLDALLFAERHRDEVAGLVLVDAVHPGQLERLPPARLRVFHDVLAQLRIGQVLVRLGLPRLLGLCPGRSPPDAREVALARGCRANAFDESSAELASLAASCREAGPPGSLADLPLVVLARGLPEDVPLADEAARAESERVWRAMQGELAQLSSRGELRIAGKSRHYVHLDEPERVVQAISDVVLSVRASSGVRP